MFPLIIQTPPISNPRNKQYLLTRVTPSNGCSIGRRPRDKTDEITRKRRIKEKRNKISRDIPLPVLDIRDGRLAKADFLMESGNSQTTAISSGIRYEERKIYDRESSWRGGVSSSFEAYSWHRSSSTTVQISWKRPYSHSAERGKFSKGRTGSIFSGHRVCISSVIGGMRFRIGGGDRGLEESKHSLMPALCPSHPSKPALDATPILNDLRLCSFQVCLQLDSPSCSFITIYSDFYFISTNLGFAFIFFTFFF